MYINGGVNRTDDGTPIFTKTTLKAMVKEDPHYVTFYRTSTLDEQDFEGPLNKLPVGLKLSVCGPDPHRTRRWYATIERTHQDQVKVT